jgi:amino acid adenylation domain-containing protein
MPGCRTHATIRIAGPLDAAAMGAAMKKVVGRHEILRTTFYRRTGIKYPYQVIHEEMAPSWEYVDLSGLAPADRGGRAAALLEAERARSIDLESGPPLRACLMTLSPQEHLLSISLPSLCGDENTLRLMVREAARMLEGDGAAAFDEVLQYADYAEWLRELRDSGESEDGDARAFWDGLHFEEAAYPILPLEQKGEVSGAFAPESVDRTILGEVVERIGRLADGRAVSARTVALTCWAILLARMTGRTHVRTSIIADGRTQPELGGALGLFARALPIAGRVDRERPWSAMLSECGHLIEAAERYQDQVPGAIDARDDGAGSTAAVEFEWAGPVASFEAAGSRWTFEALEGWSSTPVLRLGLRDDGTSWRARFHYDPRRLRRNIVAVVADSFEAILADAVRRPDARADELNLLSSERRRELLETFNQTAIGYPRQAAIHELFESQAAHTPDRPALRHGDCHLSYMDVNARANQIAHHLRRAGIGPGVAVGLCVARSAEMIVGLLGILKAGGAYVPLHPDQPKARLGHQLAESRAPVLLTQEALLDRLPDFAGRIVCLDRDQPLLYAEPRENPSSLGTADDLAYVIYTSGSTGVPKGVAVRHRSLVNYSRFIVHRLRIRDGERLHFATVSTLSADLGNTSIFPSLISGGCLHVIPQDAAMDGSLFADYSGRHPIDVLKITPSHLSSLMAAAADGGQVLPRRTLIFGGEALSWDLVDRVSRVGTCEVINHYGPTEATIGALTFRVEDGEIRRMSPTTVPIGRPIANTRVYILDERRQPVPIGVVGELWIGGEGLAQGYLNQPEQTAERFAADPFRAEAGARMYRTGDLARYLPGGNVEFLGRSDHQVKVRGFRVELAEIEAVLERLPAIGKAVVTAVEEQPGDLRIVAYLVPSGSQDPEPSELRAALAEYLPDYMIPAALVVMDRLPLTPNGKVDRTALPRPGEPREAAGFVAPRNPVEEALAGIWREVLGVERVGIADNFFELGGHSLLATQVMVRIRNTFQVQLPLRAIFDAPTLEGMSAAIVEVQGLMTDGPEVDRLLDELEDLSDDEVRKLLMAGQ